MLLYWSDRSPYVRKVMVALHEAGLAHGVELRAVVVTLRAREPQVVAVNPLGQIPTLIIEDGTALYDSAVICEYIAGLAPQASLLPTPAAARFAALRRQALGDGMMDTLMRWYSERSRGDDPRGAEYVAVCRAKLLSAVDDLEAGIDERRGEPDVGDIAIGCALTYADFRFAELDWRQGHPNTVAWLDTLMRRPSFESTQFGAGLPGGVPGAEQQPMPASTAAGR